MLRFPFRFVLFICLGLIARGEDGYRLWLRYDLVPDEEKRREYASALTQIVLPKLLSPSAAPGQDGARPALMARDELVRGLHGLLGVELPVVEQPSHDGALILGLAQDPAMAGLVNERDWRALGEEGFVLRRIEVGSEHRVLLAANREIGLLYGAFALLREIKLQHSLQRLEQVSAPRIQRRMLDHWDNLNRTVERGFAGLSIWEWFQLPDYVNPRYRDYARACASVGINGSVLNNVNADAHFLTAPYLEKVAAVAGALRPYGIRVYLSARFSAPIEVGGLKSADPLDSAVKKWWQEKAAEIYRLIPDFGGFLVKANSEGQPGPQAYKRSHAEGANVIADAVAPFGGIVLWRAFVYDDSVPDDRAKQAYNEFKPLDGTFHNNVIVQVKNGAIDFMPREPFHPLFGVMPKTPLALEVQITQEYLGAGTQLAFLAPLFKETLDAPTFRDDQTVGQVIEGRKDGHSLSAIAGVANVGTDRNWCGHPLGSANWYAYGRLAWDYQLSAQTIAEEWTRLTLSSDDRTVQTITSMLMASRETVVDYSMPLGLHHIMAEGHHYGPGPWVDRSQRADWNSVYYHRADAKGLGFNRTKTGSDALSQYAPALNQRWGDLATCPDELLLWFHHVPWDYKMRSGATLWDELCRHYQRGVESVRSWQKAWAGLSTQIDPERFAHVAALLHRQEADARIWRDACIQYFQTFSKMTPPAGVEPPEHPLEYYIQRETSSGPGRPR